MADSCTAILDVGKTHTKLSLWSRDGRSLERRSRANEAVQAEHYRALDAGNIGTWAAETLRDFAARHAIATIVPVGHGAAATVLRDGRLARGQEAAASAEAPGWTLCDGVGSASAAWS